MLSKQSIRGNVQVLANGEPISKDELITMSEGWSEREENLFRKMIKQGGVFKIGNVKFKTIVPELLRDNKGDFSTPLKSNE